ncbi:unnamed protein product [Sphenostylis stenocarpa]|uniref:Uncharacterized protein n=1 Tax=Sphenostylis stenocarpa TaxID=92480 RepID=A0AA86VAZ3_9FABA|nr:unnamed protein product [Sphenostylis stenocarpa]
MAKVGRQLKYNQGAQVGQGQLIGYPSEHEEQNLLSNAKVKVEMVGQVQKHLMKMQVMLSPSP